MAARIIKRSTPGTAPQGAGVVGAPKRNPNYVSKHGVPANSRPRKDGPITEDGVAEFVEGVWIEFQRPGGKQRCIRKCFSTGGQCRKWAEEGVDKCKFHGGVAASKRLVPRRYRSMHPKLADKVQEHLTDPHWKDMAFEVAMIRSMIEARTTQEVIGPMDEAIIADRFELLRKMQHTIAQIEEGMKVTLNIGQVHTFAEQLLRIVVDALHLHVKDEKVKVLVSETVAKGVDQLMSVGVEGSTTGD